MVGACETRSGRIFLQRNVQSRASASSHEPLFALHPMRRGVTIPLRTKGIVNQVRPVREPRVPLPDKKPETLV